MGTKRQLAPMIAEIVAYGRPGPFLDLFSGMCSVGRAVGRHRQIWSNDLQLFAHDVAGAVFCSKTSPPSCIEAAALCRPAFSENVSSLEKRFAHSLLGEREALKTANVADMDAVAAALPWFDQGSETQSEHRRLARRPSTFPYRLFTMSFAGVYFSLEQCIAIDSLKFAFDHLRQHAMIDDDVYRWFNLALCQALSRCTTSPGHFAQPLRLKESNSAKFFRQRLRSIWGEWMDSLTGIGPIGSKDWRVRNKCFRTDANALLAQMRRRRTRPAVIYADPPYTKDQYSRYYHVYETILLYDYPDLQGAGRCRSDRVSSNFSLMTAVAEAFERLIADGAELGCTLVISYPKNGLLDNSFERIPQMLRNHFRKTHDPLVINHFHSTMGASKGEDRYPVTEVIYSASM